MFPLARSLLDRSLLARSLLARSHWLVPFGGGALGGVGEIDGGGANDVGGCGGVMWVVGCVGG